MDRGDRQAEQQFTARLGELRRQMDEVRQHSQGFGSRSAKKTRLTTSLSVSNVGFNNRVVEVVFTPDKAGDGLGGVLSFDYTLTFPPIDFCTAIPEPLLSNGTDTRYRLYLSADDFFPIATVTVTVIASTNGSGTLAATLI